MRDLINFTASEFERTWVVLSDFTKKKYNVGGGNKSTVPGIYMVLMLMKTLKYGGNWMY